MQYIFRRKVFARSFIHRIFLLASVVAFITAAEGCSTRKRSASHRPVSPNTTVTLEEYLKMSQGGDNAGRESAMTQAVNLPASRDARDVISAAEKWLGTPYLYGGSTRKGVDCSALTMNVFLEGCGVKIPRTAFEQYKATERVSRHELQPGDLVFFSSARNKKGVAHVGLYIGNNHIIHASTSRGVVRSNLNDKYYTTNYIASGRVLAMNSSFSSPGQPSGRDDTEMELEEWMVRMSALDERLDAVIDSLYAVPDDIE